ncbi:MAG: DUF1441 family protein [Alphaproteobacteria bacterium]|nr:DUF1441 family protein [Alphaproteobacteria bacterium]
METNKSPEAPEIRNLSETARFFGITDPTLKRWIEDGCPVEKKGGNGVSWELDLRKVADWRRGLEAEEQRKLLDRAESDAQLRLELLGGDQLPEFTDDGGLGKLSARGRAEIIRAEMDKVKLSQLRRTLVPADEVRADQVRLFALIRDRMRSLPDDLGHRFGLMPEQVDEALHMIDEMLDDLATDIESMPSLKRDLADAAAA